MANKRVNTEQLTDEEVLKEFVSRFQCDGAVLLYLDSEVESGLGRWRTREGRQWVRQIMKAVNPDELPPKLFTKLKQNITLPVTNNQ